MTNTAPPTPATQLNAAAERVRMGDPRIDIAIRGPLAALLDETAIEVAAAEGTEYELHPDGAQFSSWEAALAVARAINGQTGSGR